MRLLITAGPTREPLDAVRFLSNASSGRMGYALAEAAAQAGHEVLLVSGPVDLACPQGVTRISVGSTRDMYNACLARFDLVDAVFAAAAVCDYRPRFPVTGKLKKTGGPITLELVETEDVLAELGRRKRHQLLVGFALEADNGREHALHKLKTKNCDAIVLNAPIAIGSDENDITLLGPGGEMLLAAQGPKSTLAHRLIAWLESQSRKRQSTTNRP
jgi:phosphopantothenoylcysteine decarboxylase / phosphopantothenate---cysteine ligase